jgi:chromosomal replication initiation ATPase DnaA
MNAVHSSSSVQLITAAVAAAFMVPPRELHAATRRIAPVALARQSAMYLAHVEFRMSFTDVGRAFGRAHTTVMRACEVIERRRDEPQLDATLADLTHVLRRALAEDGAAS